MAIAEWPTDSGPADYVLFAGLTAIAVVEAKRKHKDIPAVIEQADATTVLLPRQGLETDAHGNLILTFAAGAHVH